jgi:hypothetical protein
MPLSTFDDLEDDVNGILDDLEKAIPEANQEIYEAFNDFYFELDRNSSGNISASVDNLKKVNSFRGKIDKVIQRGEYGDAVTNYLKGFKASSKIINKYFSSIAVEFENKPEFYKALLDQNVKDTADKLLGSGIDANFKNPLLKVLQDNVVSGSNRKAFTKSIKDNIIGLEGETSKLLRYSNQVSSDSITQFNSNYIKTISDDLGLLHYYYRGTKIADTRPFCSRIAGKYFTEENLKKYVESQMKLNNGKGWSGMVKGENWNNFSIFRGGYSCRHYLIPISRSMYDSVDESRKYIG